MRITKLILFMSLTSGWFNTAGADSNSKFPPGFYSERDHGWITGARAEAIHEDGYGRASPLVYKTVLKTIDPGTGKTVLSDIKRSSFYRDMCALSLSEGEGGHFKFSESEFDDVNRPKILVQTIQAKWKIDVANVGTPIDALNTLLDSKDLYRALTRQSHYRSLSDGMRRLADKLEEKGVLRLGEIRALNRTLLENQFSDLTPQMFSACQQTGYMNFRPLDQARVKTAVEYYFTLTVPSDLLRKVVSSNIKDDKSRYVQTIHGLVFRPATGGPMGIPGSIQPYRQRYYIDKASGLVTG
jgi:hypothetical protein